MLEPEDAGRYAANQERHIDMAYPRSRASTLTNRSPLVLLVDDDPAVIAALELLLAVHEIDAVSAETPERALLCLDDPAVALVLTDMNFGGDLVSGREGAQLFRRVRQKRPEVPVILITAWASLEMAVTLVKEGAADYLQKPWDDDKLVARVRALLPKAPALAQSFPEGADPAGVVYASPLMHEAALLALRVAPSDAPVVITGENGAGKEGFAAMVHKNSRRSKGPFVRLDVGALPESLLEAELFGAEAGAYTGATRRRIGCFEAADGGTLFLDEIANLSLAGQAKLLRVLQVGEFQRLGSPETRRTDVRVVAATNADLGAAIRRGSFREDLYFRLAVIEIRIPPLRDRPEDIPVLAAHFLAEQGEAGRELGPEALEALARHPFPGNVRELSNRIRRAALVSSARIITPADLGLDGAPEPREAPQAAEDDDIADPQPPWALSRAPDDEERRRVESALDAAGGVVSKAASLLGLSRQAFYRRMQKLGLHLERRIRDV